jgi:hypothetical protein
MWIENLLLSHIAFIVFLVMSKAIKLSDELVNDATVHAKAQHRSIPKQIEYWAKIGKIADENQDLPFGFVKDVLVAIEEAESGDVSEYRFG